MHALDQHKMPLVSKLISRQYDLQILCPDLLMSIYITKIDLLNYCPKTDTFNGNFLFLSLNTKFSKLLKIAFLQETKISDRRTERKRRKEDKKERKHLKKKKKKEHECILMALVTSWVI